MNSLPGFGSILTAVAIFALFALEFWLTFLHVCLQAFLGVVACEKKLLQFAFDPQRLAKPDFHPCDNGALDSSHGARCFIGWAELPGICHHFFPERFPFIDVVNQPEFQRFLEAEGPPRRHQFNGTCATEDARNSLRSASSWQHAEIHFRQPDLAAF